MNNIRKFKDMSTLNELSFNPDDMLDRKIHKLNLMLMSKRNKYVNDMNGASGYLYELSLTNMFKTDLEEFQPSVLELHSEIEEKLNNMEIEDSSDISYSFNKIESLKNILEEMIQTASSMVTNLDSLEGSMGFMRKAKI